MNKLRAWYANLEPREQRVVGIGGGVLALMILVGAILLPLESAVSSSVKGIETRREDLAWMRTNAPEGQALGSQLPAETGDCAGHRAVRSPVPPAVGGYKWKALPSMPW